MTRFVYKARCTNVHELKKRKYISGSGADAVFGTENAGWYITVGGEICLYVGMEKPDVVVGQELILTLEGVDKKP